MFFIDFVVANSNPMSILVNSRSKVNFKVKYDISTNEAKNKCTSLIFMRVWLEFISEISLIIQGHFEVKGQFQGQVRENIIFNKTIQAHVQYPSLWDFDWKNRFIVLF